MPMDWEPGRSGQSRQFQMEEMVNKMKENVSSRFKQGGGKSFWIILFIILGIYAVYTSYYTVGTEETGVILRLGKYAYQVGPGLHFKIPFGIEKVKKVKTKRVFKMEFGFRTALPGVRTRYIKKGFKDESYMLTGDLNVVDLEWIIQYRISDPVNYLFQIRDVESTVRDLSEAVMRRIVGNRYASDVLTVGRVEIAGTAQKELQKLFNKYHTGLSLVTVELQNVNPPEKVRPAFNEVNAALQEKARMINEAQAAYNKEIPKAKGKAEQMITEAEGYALERVNRAKGEATRFKAILEAYKDAKEVTKRRMYIEAMMQLLKKIKEVYVVDENLKGIVPLLDLKKEVTNEQTSKAK